MSWGFYAVVDNVRRGRLIAAISHDFQSSIKVLLFLTLFLSIRLLEVVVSSFGSSSVSIKRVIRFASRAFYGTLR